MTDNISAENTLTPQQFADRIGRTPRHVRRMDKQNILKARRTVTNEPYYLEEDVKAFFNIKTGESA